MTVSKKDVISEVSEGALRDLHQLTEDILNKIVHASYVYTLIDEDKMKKYILEQFKVISESMDKIKARLNEY